MELMHAYAVAWGWRFWLGPAAIAVLSYLLGCCNGALIVSRDVFHDDVRSHGSGNAGLTNFYRTFGKRMTAAVVAIDALKVVAAVLAATAIMNYFTGGDVELATYAKYWAGCFTLLGHMFPIFFGFKGGKGVLSGSVLAILLEWRLALLEWGIFLTVVALTRYVSLGSVLAAFAFPLGTWLFVSRDPFVMGLACFLGALVIWMHRGNIARLWRGEESRFSIHRKEEAK